MTEGRITGGPGLYLRRQADSPARYVLEQTLQLLLGVWFFREPFTAVHALGFGAIWLGLAIFAGEGLWRGRRRAP